MDTLTTPAPGIGADTTDAFCDGGNSPPTDHAPALLRILFDGAPVEHFGVWKTITNDGEQDAGAFPLDAASLEVAAHAFVTGQGDDENRFVRCTPVVEPPQEPGSQGRDEDATGSMVFWGDVDTEKAGVSKDEALAAIYAVFPDKPPTLVIDSGGGLHPYWKMATFCTDLTRIRDVNAYIAERTAHVGGDSAVKNVGRVMRLAGTINRKPGRENALVSVYDSTGAVYDLSDFDAVPTAPVSVTPAPRGTANTKITTGGRNSTLISLAGTMRYRGMGEAAIAAALLADNRERCEPPLDDDEVRKIARSVMRYPPANDNGFSVRLSGRDAGGEVPTEPPPGYAEYIAGRSDLWTVMVKGVPPVEWLVPHFLPETGVTYLFAEPEAGKTWLMIHAIVTTVRAGKHVLVIDEEAGIARTAARLLLFDLPQEEVARIHHFPYKSGGNLAAFANIVHYYMKTNDVALAVCDSVSKMLAAFGLEENANTDATNLAAALWTPIVSVLERAVLLIDHVPHGLDRPRGAGAKMSDVDLAWYAKKTKPFGPSLQGEVQLERKKDRNGTDAPLFTRWAMGGGGDGKAIVEYAGEGKETEKVITIANERDAERVAIVRDAETAGIAYEQWRAATGDNPDTFKSAVRRLVKSGAVLKRTDGLYIVPGEKENVG